MIMLLIISAMLLIVTVNCQSHRHQSWHKTKYDFIVVGAGAAGPPIAARLSENRAIKVLLLEAGGFPIYTTKIPYFTGPLHGVHDWAFQTERQDNAMLQYVEQKSDVPRGKGLGGSTLINAMVVTRGNKLDYDTWKDMGNNGWGYDDLLPFFKKYEDYENDDISAKDASYHGFEGPVTVNRAPYRTAINDAFLEAGQAMGYSNVDYNGHSQTGFSVPVFNLRDGSRCSTYTAYLEPLLKRKNLVILTFATVTKVLFDSHKRATGVEFQKDGEYWEALAKKEVILSAGAIKTPQLLMLSGIGPKEVLEKFKIPVLVDLPGVGQNLMDHVGVIGSTFTSNPNVGINPMQLTPEAMEEWEVNHTGIASVPFRVQGLAFVNSKFAQLDVDYPDLEIIVSQPPSINPGIALEVLSSPAFVPSENLPIIGPLPFLLRPKSKGYVSIRSTDPFDSPIIQPNYLSHPDDVEVLVDALNMTYLLMNQESFQQLGVKPIGPLLPGCENYTQYSEDYFRCQIRNYAFSIFHFCGSCKMGHVHDPMAVVDPQLKVRGVSKLRIADASIFPTIPSAHIMAAAIMVGEKAAAMLIEEWNIHHKASSE